MSTPSLNGDLALTDAYGIRSRVFEPAKFSLTHMETARKGQGLRPGWKPGGSRGWKKRLALVDGFFGSLPTPQ